MKLNLQLWAEKHICFHIYWFSPWLVFPFTGFPLYWFYPLLVVRFTGISHYWFSPLLFSPVLVSPILVFTINSIHFDWFQLYWFASLLAFLFYGFPPLLAFPFTGLPLYLLVFFLFYWFSTYCFSPLLGFSFTGFLLFWFSPLVVFPLLVLTLYPFIHELSLVPPPEWVSERVRFLILEIHPSKCMHLKRKCNFLLAAWKFVFYIVVVSIKKDVGLLCPLQFIHFSPPPVYPSIYILHFSSWR